MVLAYCVPVVTVFIAVCERNSLAGEYARKTMVAYSAAAVAVKFTTTLSISWVFCFVWLCAGVYGGGPILKRVSAALIVAVIADVTLTEWALDESYYEVAQTLYGISEIIDFKTGAIRKEALKEVFLWMTAAIIRKCQAPVKPRPKVNPETPLWGVVDD